VTDNIYYLVIIIAKGDGNIAAVQFKNTSWFFSPVLTVHCLCLYRHIL